jgi:hypothetical protein
MWPESTRVRVAAIVLLTAAAGVYAAGPAGADSTGLTLRYTCALPPFPAQPMTAHLTWHTADSVPVGEQTPVLPVDATATMSDTITEALGLLKATTVEGTVDATGTVAAPARTIKATVPLTVPRTAVPASGPITVTATGQTPVYVFQQPGHATISVGSGLTVHLVPRDANGATVVGQVDTSCTLDPEQRTVLSSFEITPPKSTPAPTTKVTTRAAVAAPTVAISRSPRSWRTALAVPHTAPTSPTTSVAADTQVAEVPDPGVPATTPAIATAAHDEVLIASTTHQAEVDPRLMSGVILAGGAGVLGCVWWLRRRRSHDGRHY